MYEANPMAFIVEQAGGAATHRPRAHPRRAADRSLHQRVPVILGSRNEVDVAVATTASTTRSSQTRLRRRRQPNAT